jgi:hypothetical protein
MEVGLGDKAKDTVTGFTGVVVAITEWLNGCVRLTLQPEGVTKEGKTYENGTFDAHQIKLVKRDVVPSFEKVGSKSAKTGGPQNDQAALRRN